MSCVYVLYKMVRRELSCCGHAEQQYKSTTLAKLLFCFLSLLFFDVLVNVGLSLSVAPKITSDGTDKILAKGKKFTLECEATGSPTPTVVWKRNGEIDPRQKVILMSFMCYV